MTLQEELVSLLHKEIKAAADSELYEACLEIVRQRSEQIPTVQGTKKVYYIRAEFLTGTQLGKKRVRFINCPFALAYTGAFLLRALSLGRIDLREKVQRLCEDRAYPNEAASADFGYDPVSFPEGVRGEIHAYLQSRRKKTGTQI